MGGAFRLWGPVVLWAAALFVASAQPDLGPAGRIPDYLSHASAYMVFALLLARALAGGFPRILSARGQLLVVLLATLYGASDEYHQSFVPGRDASLADVVKDFGGAVLGAWLYRRLAAGPPRTVARAPGRWHKRP